MLFVSLLSRSPSVFDSVRRGRKRRESPETRLVTRPLGTLVTGYDSVSESPLEPRHDPSGRIIYSEGHEGRG